MIVMGRKEPTKDRRTTIVASLIGAIALIAVPITTFYLNKSQPANPILGGLVQSKDRVALAGARVTAIGENGFYQVLTTDSGGHFSFSIPANLHLLKLSVTADGFSPYSQDISLSSPNIQEVVLLDKSHVNLEPNKQQRNSASRNTTNGADSPIINGDHNSISH